MILYISGTTDRSEDYAFTGVLHTDDRCMALHGENRRPWEATPSEVLAADYLCGICAPRRFAPGITIRIPANR